MFNALLLAALAPMAAAQSIQHDTLFLRTVDVYSHVGVSLWQANYRGQVIDPDTFNRIIASEPMLANAIFGDVPSLDPMPAADGSSPNDDSDSDSGPGDPGAPSSGGFGFGTDLFGLGGSSGLEPASNPNHSGGAWIYVEDDCPPGDAVSDGGDHYDVAVVEELAVDEEDFEFAMEALANGESVTIEITVTGSGESEETHVEFSSTETDGEARVYVEVTKDGETDGRRLPTDPQSDDNSSPPPSPHKVQQDAERKPRGTADCPPGDNIDYGDGLGGSGGTWVYIPPVEAQIFENYLEWRTNPGDPDPTSQPEAEPDAADPDICDDPTIVWGPDSPCANGGMQDSTGTLPDYVRNPLLMLIYPNPLDEEDDVPPDSPEPGGPTN